MLLLVDDVCCLKSAVKQAVKQVIYYTAMRALIFAWFSVFQIFIGAKINTEYEDAYLQTPEIIRKYGYPAETHEVVTEDGYILTLHRIPREKTDENYKGSIILQHGILATSAAWVVSGPEVGFGYLLNDAGFDVWLPNLRGNFYSRAHKRLSPNDPKFWDFSFHEAGVYDLPAIVDYILEQTESKNLTYVGHSMGTTVSYVFLSMKPEYNKKVPLVYSLAPAGSIAHTKSWAGTGFTFLAKFRTILKSLRFNEVAAQTYPDTDSRVKFCDPKSNTHELCKYFIFYSSGTPEERINDTNVPNIAGHTPAGCSLDMMVHYGQNIGSNEFAQFDFGAAMNLRKYGHLKPPKYNLAKISAKVVIYYGEPDTLTVPQDVVLLASHLPNLQSAHQIPGYGHNDFNYAKDADIYVYKPIIKSLLNKNY